MPRPKSEDKRLALEDDEETLLERDEADPFEDGLVDDEDVNPADRRRDPLRR